MRLRKNEHEKKRMNVVQEETKAFIVAPVTFGIIPKWIILECYGGVREKYKSIPV